MAPSFSPNSHGRCFLCGSESRLSGEHKIKRSLLAEYSSGGPLILHNPEARRPRLAQSPKSRVFHFKSKLCEVCNTARTQLADRAFEQYHHDTLAQIAELGSSLQTESQSGFAEPSNDVFRYFAKLMCGFLADVGGPRPNEISEFAIGSAEFNPIFLNIQKIPMQYSEEQFTLASHGGLGARFGEDGRYIRSLEGSVTVGIIQYEYWVQLRWRAKIELERDYADFVERARASIMGCGS